MKKPYLILGCDYDNSTGGRKVQHYLCHALNERGFDAYVNSEVLRPDWNTKTYRYDLGDDFIVVQPEGVEGNPYKARTVVRWVLNTPGNRAPLVEYADDEIIFPYMPAYDQWGLGPSRYLQVPVLDVENYANLGLQRGAPLIYIGKGNITPETWEIVHNYPVLERTANGDRQVLLSLFNIASLLYSYDDVTAVNTIARMCGCPVVIIPDGRFTKEQLKASYGDLCGLGYGIDEVQYAIDSIDSNVVMETHRKSWEQFERQLDNFIQITQEAANRR